MTIVNQKMMDSDGIPLRVLPKRLVVSNQYVETARVNERLEDEDCFASASRSFASRGMGKISEKYKPLDSAIGKIRHIAVGYRSSTDEDERNAFNKIYADLVIKLGILNRDVGGGISVSTISHSKKTRRELERINFSIKELAYFTGDYLTNDFSLDGKVNDEKTSFWLQDHLIPLQGNGRKIILSQRENIDRRRSSIAKSLSMLPSTEDVEFSFESRYHNQIEGGNILFVGDYTLVGRSCCRNSKRPIVGSRYNLLDDETFKEKLSLELGVEKNKIIIIGEETERSNTGGEIFGWLSRGQLIQPAYHIDLFITSAGKIKIENKEGVTIEKDLVLVGKIFDEHLDGEIKQEIKEQLDWNKEQLDKVCDKLTKEGIEVKRIPLPITYIHQNEGGVWKRIWLLASYNNCIVQYEECESERCVLVPKYSGDFSNEYTGFKYGRHKIFGGNWSDLKTYEKTIREVWESLGFRVIFLTNFLPLLSIRGAVHCITKVLSRDRNY